MTTPRDRFFSGASAGGSLSRAAMVGHDEHFASSNEPVNWAWQDILQSEHLALFGGPPGVGKTELAAHLLVALANPTDTVVEVLGHRVMPVAEGKFVVLVEEENSRRSITRKLAETCVAFGLPVAQTLDRIVTVARSGMLVDLGQDKTTPWGQMLDRARAGLVGALFIDSWATVIRAESNSEESQARAAGCLRDFVELSGGPVVAIVHTRKGDATSLEDIAGSHQRAAAADVVLLVTADKENGRVLSSKVVFAKLRDGEGDHPEPVSFSVTKIDGAKRITVDGVAEDDDTPAHDRVYALVLDEELSQSQIRERLKMSGKRVSEAIGILKASKRVQFRKTKVRGQDTWLVRAKGGDLAVHQANGLLTSAHERSRARGGGR